MFRKQSYCLGEKKMIDIYVLEDDVNQQFCLEKMIDEVLVDNQWQHRCFELFGEPSRLITLIDETVPQIFFLDLDINGDKTKGIEVAKAIRDVSKTATLVFVTTHSEFMLLTYRAQVSALDFIDKTDSDLAIKENLQACLKKVVEGQVPRLSLDTFIFENNKTKIRIPFEDILYFETAEAHRLMLVTRIGQRNFYGTIREVKKANHKLFQCHKSYLINPDNVVSLDKKEGLVYFVGGKSCYVSKKRMKELKTKLES